MDFKAADFIGRNILGSILECHVRGLYSYVRKTSIIPEFQADAAKVDIIDDIYQRAAEIIISNKNTGQLHFNSLDSFERFWNNSKILLTKDERGQSNGITLIPFYEYVYELSGETIVPVL